MDDPIEDGFLIKMEAIATALDVILNHDGQDYGFMVHVTPFDAPGGRTSYIGNIQREDARALMMEIIERWNDKEEHQ